ncbi:MAG: DUF3460 family protein [Burkholderiaceae bacterium]
MYESDTTRFLRELKAQKPDIAEQQRIGRAIWWDHPQDLETIARNEASRVPQSAYVYQSAS